jgi:large subunit ribosomal protein L17
MHRHGYKGRKFGRETDQRKALLRGLICALILNHSINTTLTRAKEMRREAEKLITIARKGGLQNRRLLIARLGQIEVASHLMDVIAPRLQRDSGYLRIVSTGVRRGDNAETATIAFVDDLSIAPEQDSAAETPAPAQPKTPEPTKETK